MAFTQQDLDALDEAIAAGELEVSINDRKIRYRSIEQLERARRFVESRLGAGPTKSTSSIRTYRVGVSKL